MNIFRTDKTYKTIANAEKALDRALDKVGIVRENIRYTIAAREVEGTARFAPVVLLSGPAFGSKFENAEQARIYHMIMALPQHGITIAN